MENVTSVDSEKSAPGEVSVESSSAPKNRRNNYGPGGRFGHRRSPTTGHRRRHLTPDPNQTGIDGGENDSDVSVDAPRRSLSAPRDDRRQRHISSTTDDEADDEQLKLKSKAKPKKNLSAVELKKRAKRLIESESTTDDATPENVLRRRQRSKSKETEAEAQAETVKETKSPTSKESSSDSWWRIWPRAKSAEPEAKAPNRPKRTRSASRGKSDRESTDDQQKPHAPSRSRPRSRPNSELYKDDSSDDFWKPKGSMEKLHSSYKEKKKEEKAASKSTGQEQEQEPKRVLEKETASKNKEEDKTVGRKSKILETRKLGTSAKPKTAEKVEVTENDGGLLIKRKINWKFLTSDSRAEWKNFVADNSTEIRKIRSLKNKCISDLLLMIIFCGVGAVVFRSIEGAFENFYKCGVKRVKRDFIDNLWIRSHNLPEEEWKSLARHKLMDFEEQLHTAFEAGLSTYSGQRSWSFINAFIYCLTVITTIGYGHITPSTTTGKIITIIYAVFGIPMFLILLADFGKMFTRCIKFLWAFVRRLYYTGSCRKVRRNVPQEVMKGVQIVYSMTKKRRPSAMNGNQNGDEQSEQNEQNEQTVPQQLPFLQSRAENESPGTPNLSTFAIDDEFNLPISVAITILLLYIICGASVFYYWEEWGFLESFYFVFISMSTIGFGDYVPKNQMYMMASIVYLVFGLALTSMCINVVQEKLSDSIRRASAKIGATIGFQDDITIKVDDTIDADIGIVEGKLTVINDASSTENQNSNL